MLGELCSKCGAVGGSLVYHCGKNKRTGLHPVCIVSHHIGYKEIHGEEKIIRICQSCHQKTHKRLRKLGKCKVPASALNIMSKTSWRSRRPMRIIFQEYLLPHVRLREIIDYNMLSDRLTIYSNLEVC